MIRVGLAGIGFMGWIHWLAYQRTPGIEVAAVATRDPRKQAGDWTGIHGNFGPPGEHVDLSQIRVYSDWRELVSDPSLDLIDICLPPNQHSEAVKAAASGGKHVFCEKPLALTAVQCDELVAHVKRCDRQLLVGHVLPFFAEYQFAWKTVCQGQYGAPRGGHFRRVIARPDWLPDFFNPQTVGGPLIDLHVHDAHFIRLLFGMPRGVFSRGWCEGETAAFATTLFDFAQSAVSATMGVIDQPGRPFTHGFELLLNRGTMQFEYAAITTGDESMPFKLFDQTGQVIRLESSETGPLAAFEAEIAEVRDAVMRGTPSSLLSGELARDAIVMCEAQQRSVTRGEYVPLPDTDESGC
ncbi:MAG TPA: Gfo/Idh/MocA family oxidoreductase [Pirellulaceae bacterium]|nr:Gfo/Idh/MocA family oxidoreductase [Pirellulaceae bacterium]